jgi:hypothetical protein
LKTTGVLWLKANSQVKFDKFVKLKEWSY